MRFYVLTGLLIAALALVAGGAGYWCLRAHASHNHADDSLAWLRTEFSLSDAQMAQIEHMHAQYAVICAEHCELIRNQQQAVDALKRTQAPQPEIQAAEAEARLIDAHCVASVKTHVQEIAAVIGGSEGERYLNKVLPRLADFDHATTPNLRLKNGQADGGFLCH